MIGQQNADIADSGVAGPLAAWCGGQICRPNFINPVYTIQPVVECLYTRYSRLSNRLSNGFDNRFDNRIERTAVRSTGCQTGLYNKFDKHGLTTL